MMKRIIVVAITLSLSPCNVRTYNVIICDVRWKIAYTLILHYICPLYDVIVVMYTTLNCYLNIKLFSCVLNGAQPRVRKKTNHTIYAGKFILSVHLIIIYCAIVYYTCWSVQLNLTTFAQIVCKTCK